MAAKPPSKFQYDVIVIGTGPGGEGAAMQAVKGGRKVAVVDIFDDQLRYRQPFVC
jgi:NAD(P) transhydrogenase